MVKAAATVVKSPEKKGKVKRVKSKEDDSILQIDVQAAGPERNVIRFKVLMESFIEHMYTNHAKLAVSDMKFRYNSKEVEAEQTPGELMMKELDMMYACPIKGVTAEQKTHWSDSAKTPAKPAKKTATPAKRLKAAGPQEDDDQRNEDGAPEPTQQEKRAKKEVKPAKAAPESTDSFAKGYDISTAPTGSYINRPAAIKDTLAVGTVVDCWWPKENCWYRGTVSRAFPDGEWRVQYEDGDVRKQNMTSSDWVWSIAKPPV